MDFVVRPDAEIAVSLVIQTCGVGNTTILSLLMNRTGRATGTDSIANSYLAVIPGQLACRNRPQFHRTGNLIQFLVLS